MHQAGDVVPQSATNISVLLLPNCCPDMQQIVKLDGENPLVTEPHSAIASYKLNGRHRGQCIKNLYI